MMRIVFLCLLIISFSSNANEEVYVIEFKSEPLALSMGTELKSTEATSKKQILADEHNLFLNSLSSQFKQKSTVVSQNYYYALNGIALKLDKSQLKWAKEQPNVKSVSKDFIVNLHTDAGPQWIGAENVWDGMALDTPGNQGEGVVVGIIDTGIYPQHPSFQQVSQAGTANQYVHSNPRGQYYGLCNSQICNNKLIGIYDFTDEGSNGIDTVGHGSHVAGTAAGNVYSTTYQGLSFTVSGVAPRANIISYKACHYSEENSGGSCSHSSLLGAIDQATANQVDVVNYSIGSDTPCSPWGSLDGNGDYCGNYGVNQTAAAMLNARNAGVLFVVSAGNSGPGKSTIGAPGNAPWVITAANSTHSRQLQSSVKSFTGGNSVLNHSDELIGASATNGIGPLRIVHAKDYGNALCGQGEAELKSQCSGTGNDVLTGASNPFSPGTFNGEIVVCDRGTYGRVEKGFNVKQAGAAGYVLANTVGQQESITADNHCLPGTHLGNIAGTRLRNWLDSGSNHMAEITGQSLIYDDALGDVMNSSSSRGPTTIIYNTPTSSNAGAVEQNFMKPNISAPGTSILAADYQTSGLAVKSGTSMSAPHISGAVALLKAKYPNYTPSQIVSSLVLTADNQFMLKEDSSTKADFADMGAGRTRIDTAIGNSLYFDVSRSQFLAANPQEGGDVRYLNLPEIVDNNCYPTCSFTRKVKMLGTFNVVDAYWQVSIEKSNDLGITVTPDSFDFSNGSEVELTIDIDATANNVIGDWAEAKILFEVKSASNSNPMVDTLAPSVSKLPVAVYVPSGNYPQIVSRTSTTRHGRFEINLSGITPMTEAVYQGSKIIAPETQSFFLSPNDNTYPFNDDGEYISSSSSHYSTFAINNEKVALIVEIEGDNQADLYIGQDLDINDTPDKREILCEKVGFSSSKTCVLRNVKPGKYWILTDNRYSGNNNVMSKRADFTVGEKAQKANFDYGIGLINGSGLYVQGPVKTSENVELDVIYELPQFETSDDYYGVISVGADAESIGKTAVIPVKIIAPDFSNEKLYSLNNEVAEFNLTGNESYSNMYIDTGLGTTKIKLSSYNKNGQINFYKTSFEFNPLSIKPDLSNISADFTINLDAPIIGVPPPGWIPEYTKEVDISGYEPARWYIEVVDSEHTNTGYWVLKASVEYNQDVLISPNQSLWFNPQRSGWGIDLIQTNSFQATTWYTYDKNNQPTWYQAAGAITFQNQWAGRLRQFGWNGENARGQELGIISLIYLNDRNGVISISLPDKTHSEKIRSIYAKGQNCPSIHDTQIDVTGLWHHPDKSGFGSTLIASESDENIIFYYYDDSGRPRWVIGNSSLDNNQTIMNQIANGFCPDCEATPLQLIPVGTITTQYNSDSTGLMSAEIDLVSPLSGSWSSSGETKKLNRNFGCVINQ